MTTKKHILFIGAGRMAQAIIGGIKDKEEFSILVANSGNKERLQYVKDTYGVETTDHWQQEVSKMEIILLAAPPEVFEPILADLNQLINRQLIISIAAGISPTDLEEKLPQDTPVACFLPNTAAKLGQSITLYALGHSVNQEHVDWTKALISSIGEYEKLSEQQIHELAAVTGSAPAFIYRVAEALVKITLDSGVTKEQAQRLVAQMIAGSAALLKTGAAPRDLANEVATPGGSTEAGLDVLDSNNLDQLLKEAINACRKKAGDLVQ